MIRKAFSFVELLTVIGIIGILASMLLGVGLTVRNRARDATTSSRMEAILTAASSYSQDGSGLAYVLQNPIGPTTFGGSLLYGTSYSWNSKSWVQPAPWKSGTYAFAMTDMNVSQSSAILQAIGITNANSASDTRTASQRPWNDAWGNPLAVAFMLYQPPSGSADSALTGYGYNRSVTLAVAALGPNPSGQSTTAAAIWTYVNQRCDPTTSWKTDPGTGINAFAAPPWRGTKSFIQALGDRCQLTAPMEIR